MSIKAVGIAIKLTLEGSSQAGCFQTWIFVIFAITCIITQLNYLNKVSALISSSIGSISPLPSPFFGFLKYIETAGASVNIIKLCYRVLCLYMFVFVFGAYKKVGKILRREISESGAFQFVGGQHVDSY